MRTPVLALESANLRYPMRVRPDSPIRSISPVKQIEMSHPIGKFVEETISCFCKIGTGPEYKVLLYFG
jgi:hypothetical protein